MKNVKALGYVGFVLFVLSALNGVAMATTVTSTEGSTPSFHAVNEGSVTFTSPTFHTLHCDSSVILGKIEQHGSSTAAGGKVSGLAITSCLGEEVTPISKPGSFVFQKTSTTGNGSFVSTGAELRLHTSVGECIFGTFNTYIGTLTGSNQTKGKATLDVNSQPIPLFGGGFFCPSSVIWEGSYVVTSPAEFAVH